MKETYTKLNELAWEMKNITKNLFHHIPGINTGVNPISIHSIAYSIDDVISQLLTLRSDIFNYRKDGAI